MGKAASLWGGGAGGSSSFGFKRLQRSGKQRYNDYPCGI